MSESIKIFISYAHEDENLREQLEMHLEPLKRQGLISPWHDRDIRPGREWGNEIDAHLSSARIILLLVSAAFLASEYCYSTEMMRALKMHEIGQARVIPIILRPVDWEGVPFSKLLALPADARPVTGRGWYNVDEALADVAQGIRKVVEEIRSHNSGINRGTRLPPLSGSKEQIRSGDGYFKPNKFIFGSILVGAVVLVLLSAMLYIFRPGTPIAVGKGNSSPVSTFTGTPSTSIAAFIPRGWHESDDPLSDNSKGYHWDEGTGLYASCQFRNNSYYVGIEGGAVGYAFCLAHSNTNFSDFAFQVDMKTSQGLGGGIVFRFGANGGYYFVVVDRIVNQVDQVSALVKSCPSGGNFITLRNVSLSDLNIPFSKGPHDVNTLAVVARGNMFTFFVNGKKAFQMSDSTYSQGQVGLGIGAFDQLSYAGGEMSNAKLWTP
jgi:hypothetical protein